MTDPQFPTSPVQPPDDNGGEDEPRPSRGRARQRHERRKQRHAPEAPTEPRDFAAGATRTPRATRAPDTEPTGVSAVNADAFDLADLPSYTPHTPRPPRRDRSLPMPPGRIEWMPQAIRQPVQQVKPAGGVRLPDIDWRYPRLIAYVIGCVLLFGGVIYGLNLFKDEELTMPPDAIWIGTEWTYRNPTDEEVSAFAVRLQENQIGTVYAWVSWLKEDYTWAGIRANTNTFEEVESSVRAFVQQFKEAYPLAELHGWVGVPVELGPNGYRLDDPELYRVVSEFSLYVIEDLGFDGVFLNVEQVWNHNADDFVTLLLRVRSTLGDRANISVAIPPDWSPLGATIPVPPLIRPGTEWDKAFKQRVALLTDQMAIMAYNSGLSDPNDYVEWVAYQVEVYARAIEELNAGASLIIGIPTYDDEPPGHLTVAENVPTAIAGIRRGLEASGTAANRVQGIAIYAEWTTSEQEWQQYRDLWSRRRSN